MKAELINRIIRIGIFSILLFPFAAAGQDGRTYYHYSESKLFWFMLISDTHVGVSGEVQDTDFLAWATREGKDIINPQFIVNTGDLTDSTDGGVIPIGGPYVDEWATYQHILNVSGMTPSFYYDVPGNHDAYGDENFSFYKAYSIQGSENNSTQHAWTRNFDHGNYLFIGVCTPGNDGASFSIFPWDNFGDHAGLDVSELNFIENNLAAHPDAELTLILRPILPTGPKPP